MNRYFTYDLFPGTSCSEFCKIEDGRGWRFSFENRTWFEDPRVLEWVDDAVQMMKESDFYKEIEML